MEPTSRGPVGATPCASVRDGAAIYSGPPATLTSRLTPPLMSHPIRYEETPPEPRRCRHRLQWRNAEPGGELIGLVSRERYALE